MGGGGAAIAAMMQALRSNRIILKNKRKAFDKNPAKNLKNRQELRFKKSTPKELEQFRSKLHQEQKRLKRIRILIYLVGIVFLALLIYLITA